MECSKCPEASTCQAVLININDAMFLASVFPREVLKNCGLDNIFLELCNLALKKNNKPDMWSLSVIIPVSKSGDLSKPDNYHGLSCIIAKIYNLMILDRIRGAIDPQLRENQNGF